MESKKLVLLLMLCLLLTSLGFIGTPAYALGSDEILLTFGFPLPLATKGVSSDSVMMPSLSQYGAPGEPILPFRMVKALIPQGKDVQSIYVSTGNRKVLAGEFYIAYGKTPIPISLNDTVIDQPDPAIYTSADPFPNVLFSDVLEQHIRGYKILLLKLHPVQYIPRTGELFYFETMTVTITLKETHEISPMFRNLPQDRELVMNLVDNPSEIETYRQTLMYTQQSSLVDPSYSYDYVIITNNALKSSFQPLVNSKIAKGLTATIVSVEDIMTEPAYHWNGLFGDGYNVAQFNDTQAHVRNFIKDAYQNWDIEYVLLGGDVEIIPQRKVYCYAGDYTKSDIPCDMYYGALDGSWDADLDNYFGEAVFRWTTPPPGHTVTPRNGTAGDEADFLLEVYVGKAPVTTAAQVTRFITKTLAYEQDVQTNPEADYLQNALLIGERLDTWTQAGNGMDRVADIIQQYSHTRLYARDGTYDRTRVRTELNSGEFHIVNHDGHASYRSVMGISRNAASGLTNTKYFMVYSLGCDSAAFDRDSVSERFITSPTGGAYAYIGNSRYGWYCPACSDGPGEIYMRQFYLVLNSGVTNIGKTLALSKMQELTPSIPDRWTVFGLTLLGDPETEIFTAVKAPTAHFETRKDLLASPRIGGLVDLRGTAKHGPAQGSTFSHYVIDHGSGTAPTSWSTTGITLANDGQSEVINGILATWDTTQVADDTYTLRLRAFDTEGLTGEDRRIVVVSQNAIPIHIRADGSVDPSTELIARDGDVYTLTGNIAAEGDIIVIQRDNIILDGAGYVLQGLVEKYGTGIRLSERSNVTIKNVAVTGCLYGIYLERSSHNTISGSIIQGNTHGIYLLESSNNEIFLNTITTNDYGIAFLIFSNNNIVYENWITNNQGDYAGAVWFYCSSNNSFEHNVFMNNYVHAYVMDWEWDPTASSNIWDGGYPSGGNYWDDYTGVDEFSGSNQDVPGSDGIGDTPYTVDVHNRDRYPLMQSWFVRRLITTVKSWDLPKGTENSLTSKLDDVNHLLDKGNENGAIHKLMDFINQVEALRGKKLANEQADYLTSEAQRIIDLIKG